jgi:hypothetical protein
MSIHRYPPEQIRRIVRRQALSAVIVAGVISVLVGGVVPRVNPAAAVPGQTAFSLVCVWLSMIAVTLFAVSRVQRTLRSYALEASDAELRQTQAGFPEIRLARAEVKGLRVRETGVRVLTGEPARSIFISRNVEDYPRLLEQLRAWAPEVRSGGERLPPALTYAWMIALLVCWFATGLVPLHLVLVPGVLVWLLGIPAAVVLLRNPELPGRMKASVAAAMALILLGPLARFAVEALRVSLEHRR